MSDFETEAFGELPADTDLFAVTRDGHSLAFSEDSDGRIRCIWDGVPGPPFDEVGTLRDGSHAIYASADECHVAFMAVRGDHSFVVRDGVEGPPFDALSRSVPPTFDARGRHLAYGAKVDGVTRLVVDDEIVGGRLAPIAAALSPDGSRTAYVEMREASDGRIEQRIVVDETRGDWFLGMRNAWGALQFGPDGRRFAAYTIDTHHKARWVVDGVPQRWFNDEQRLSLARHRGVGVLEAPLVALFSPDGSRFAYFADVVEKGVAIIEDDRPGPLFKAVGMPAFSPDSLHLAYAGALGNDRLALVLDDRIVGEWRGDVPGRSTFSIDSRHVALSTIRTERTLFRKSSHVGFVHDGRLTFEAVGRDVAESPAFSPDGLHVAWWFADDRNHLVVDDVIVDEAPAIVGGQTYDSTGTLHYVGTIGSRYTVVSDGQPGPLADAVVSLGPVREWYRGDPFAPETGPFRLDPNGRHVAWIGRFGEAEHPIVDQSVGPARDRLLDCAFDEQGDVVWWGQQGRSIVAIRHAFAI